MQTFTDEQMQQQLMHTKEYTLVLLTSNPDYKKEGYEKIIWEHARRNFSLRAEGLVSIVAPVTKEASVSGMYIFNTDIEKANEIMKDDPAVMEGIFSFEAMPIRSFPGDALPS